jgi:hypothetical protein
MFLNLSSTMAPLKLPRFLHTTSPGLSLLVDPLGLTHTNLKLEYLQIRNTIKR